VSGKNKYSKGVALQKVLQCHKRSCIEENYSKSMRISNSYPLLQDMKFWDSIGIHQI